MKHVERFIVTTEPSAKAIREALARIPDDAQYVDAQIEQWDYSGTPVLMEFTFERDAKFS